VVAALAVYAGANLAALAASEPREFGDTYRYFGSTLWDIQNPGITPVLVYTAIADPGRVAVFQVVLSTLTWSLLAVVAWLRLDGTWVRWPAAGGVLLLSMTAPFWSWTMLLGSESIAISAGVLWLASLVWLAGHLTRPQWPVAWSVLAAALLVVSRPQLVPVVLAVQAVCIVWSWRATRTVPTLVLASLATVATSAYAVTRLQLLASAEVFRYRYAIDNYVDKTPSFRAFADATMPTCEPLTAAINGPRPWDDVWVLKQELMSRCPETYLWLRSPQTSLISWTSAVPGDALANFAAVMPTVILEPYTQSRAMPPLLDAVLMPSWPAWLITLLYLATGVVLAALARVRPHVSVVWALGSAVIAASIAGMLYLIWAADGIELTRHLMPFTALAAIAAFLLPITQPSRRPSSAAS
jgi:hypothetical protein